MNGVIRAQKAHRILVARDGVMAKDSEGAIFPWPQHGVLNKLLWPVCGRYERSLLLIAG